MLCHVFVSFVSEHDIFECNMTIYFFRIEMQSLRLILNINGQIQVLEDAVEERQCTLNIHLNIEQLPDWEEESAL